MKYLPAYLVFFVMYLFLSCSVQDEISPQKTNSVELHNGYLQFPNQEALEDRIRQNSSMAISERIKWEKSMGFASMISFHEEAMDKEDQFFAEMITSGKNLDNCIIHSPFVNQNSKYMAFDEDGWVTANTFWFDAAYILNKEGFVRVGSMIYKYSLQDLKSIYLDSDLKLSDIRKLFDTAEADKSSNKHFSKEGHYTHHNGVFVSKPRRVSSVEFEENGRTSYDGSCTDSTPFPYKLKGTVDLTLILVQSTTSFPCGSFQCTDPTLCFFGQCEGVLTTDYRTIYEFESKSTYLLLPNSMNHSVTAAYSKNGVAFNDSFSGSGSSFRATIFNELDLNAPIDVTNATTSFQASTPSPSVILNCSETF